MSVWVTRSSPDNLRTARELRALGQRPLMVPVLTTTTTYQPPIAALPDAVVFTSTHAVRHFKRHDRLVAVPIFAASGLVADAASAQGYRTITSSGGNDRLLLDLMGRVLPPGARVLVLCGEKTSSRLQAGLRGRGCVVERQVVYKPVPVQSHSISHVTGALDRVKAIVFHSRRGAERIVPILQKARWRGSLWCISDQAASACENLPGINVHTAMRPSESSLLDMISQLNSAPGRQMSKHPSRDDTILAALLRESPSIQNAAGNDNFCDNL